METRQGSWFLDEFHCRLLHHQDTPLLWLRLVAKIIRSPRRREDQPPEVPRGWGAIRGPPGKGVKRDVSQNGPNVRQMSDNIKSGAGEQPITVERFEALRRLTVSSTCSVSERTFPSASATYSHFSGEGATVEMGRAWFSHLDATSYRVKRKVRL